jgi:hypothetical protein
MEVHVAEKQTGGANIVPFGKYKGRLIEEVLVDDPGYAQWLTAQDWFRDKSAVLYQVVINRGAESQDTPEHNALQVRFLEGDFCQRFWRSFVPGLNEPVKFSVEFETHGTDVLFTCNFNYGQGMPIPLQEMFHSWKYYSDPKLAVELKPTVGDDYPAVLRQMKANGSTVLLLRDYTGVGATREQFIKTFEASGKRVVFLRDVEVQQIGDRK